MLQDIKIKEELITIKREGSTFSIKKSEINSQNEQGLTILMDASRSRKDSNVKTAMQAGADPNIQDILGNTALMYAVQSEYPVRKVEILIGGGAYCTLLNRNNQDILFYFQQNNEIKDSREYKLVRTGMILSKRVNRIPLNIEDEQFISDGSYDTKLEKKFIRSILKKDIATKGLAQKYDHIASEEVIHEAQRIIFATIIQKIKFRKTLCYNENLIAQGCFNNHADLINIFKYKHNSRTDNLISYAISNMPNFRYDLIRKIYEFLSVKDVIRLQHILPDLGLTRAFQDKIIINSPKSKFRISYVIKDLTIKGKFALFNEIYQYDKPLEINFDHQTPELFSKDYESTSLEMISARDLLKKLGLTSKKFIKSQTDYNQDNSSPVQENLHSQKHSTIFKYTQILTGNIIGEFLINPSIHFARDKINGKNQNISIYEYYSYAFGDINLGEFTIKLGAHFLSNSIVFLVSNKIANSFYLKYLGPFMPYICVPTISELEPFLLPLPFAEGFTNNGLVQGIVQTTFFPVAGLIRDTSLLLSNTAYCSIFDCD